MRNGISVRVQNLPGVLSHVAGMLAARAYNVDSLTVGETEDPRFSRMTIVVDMEPELAAQVKLQLQKLVTVVETENLSEKPHVERELALIRVAATPEERSGVLELTTIFRAKVVDVAANSLLVEITGDSATLDAFIAALTPYKVVGLTRSGCIAAPRGDVDLK